MAYPLFKFLRKFLRKRSETLSENIASARKVTETPTRGSSAVEAKLSNLDEEIAKFRSEVEQEMKQDEVRIKATLEEETTRIVASAEQEIAVAAAQARRGLKHFAADLAIEQAAKQLVLTPEKRPRLDRRICSRSFRIRQGERRAEVDGSFRCTLRTRFCRCGDLRSLGHGFGRQAVG